MKVNIPPPSLLNPILTCCADVAILHNIVTHAESLLSVLPERERIPTNALFHAYYAILPKIGLDADHDNRYARVLFKIGGRRGEDTLYEKFENVLAGMGIELELDVVQDGEERSCRDSSTLLSDTGGYATSFATARHRRNSETAASPWHVGAGRIRQQGQRRTRSSSPETQTTGRRAQFHNEELPIRQKQIEDGPRRRDDEQRSKEIKSWMNNKSHEANKHSRHEPRKFDYLNPTTHKSYYQDGPTAMDSYAVQVDDDQRYQQSILDQPLPQEHDFELDDWTGETDEFKIERVRNKHDESLLRRLMSQWHQEASWLQHHTTELEQAADHHDRIQLLRPTFNIWRSHFLQRQQEHEEQRIQYEQEQEAIHMREIFLGHKYFTRWVAVCREEQDRVEAARRHILTLRIFNAWQDHTVENELKVRQFVYKKFLGLWQAKRRETAAIERMALQNYEVNLAKRVFWGWFWNFAEKRAPIFWQDKSKRRDLNTWRSKSGLLQINLMLSQEAHNIRVQKAVFEKFKQRSRILRSLEIAAQGQWERKRCEMVMKRWNKQHHLVAVRKEAERRIGLIEAKSMMEKWRLQTKQQQEATHFSNLRILKDALLQWRLQAKTKQLEHQRQQQAFHVWRLAVQLKIATRVSREKLLRKFLPCLVCKTRKAVTEERVLTTTAEHLHSYHLTKSVFGQWRQRLREVGALQGRAWNMRPPPAVKDCFDRWVAVKRKTDQMQKWAVDAEFYIIGNRALGKWRKATEASKKKKRRMAYAQARRQNKLNLAKLMLDKWREKAAHIKEIEATAAAVRKTRTVALATTTLSIWRAKSQDLLELNDFASKATPRKLFEQWRVRLVQLYPDTAVATESDIIRLRSRCLRKWSRKALQYRAHEHLVSELRDKRSKRSLRLAFNHWRQTLEIRQNAGLLFDEHTGPPSPRPAAMVYGQDPKVGNLINLNESVFKSPIKQGQQYLKDLSPMKATGMTPLPAYLNTPSRRSTLARSLVGGSTTPAGLPLSTPFERRLGAQLRGDTLSAYSRRTAARPPSKLRAFDDLVQEDGDDEEDT